MAQFSLHLLARHWRAAVQRLRSVAGPERTHADCQQAVAGRSGSSRRERQQSAVQRPWASAEGLCCPWPTASLRHIRTRPTHGGRSLRRTGPPESGPSGRCSGTRRSRVPSRSGLPRGLKRCEEGRKRPRRIAVGKPPFDACAPDASGCDLNPIAPSRVQQHKLAKLAGWKCMHEVDGIVGGERLVRITERLNQQFLFEDIDKPHTWARNELLPVVAS